MEPPAFHVARLVALNDAGLQEVLVLQDQEAMQHFLGRMLEKERRKAEDTRIHLMAARALCVGVRLESYSWLLSDVLECPVAPLRVDTGTTTCTFGTTHRPGKRRVGLKKYWLFQAASEGCLACVQRYLEKEGVASSDVSETHGYSVLDWSLWAQKQGVSGSEVVTEYLQRNWLDIPCQTSDKNAEAVARQRRLSSEVQGGTAKT